MKSLEIVNDYINRKQIIEVKGDYRLLSAFVDDIRIAGVKWNDSPNENYMRDIINNYARVISMENLKLIKANLEVLEIIKNKKVELELLEYLLVYETDEKIMEAYNSNPSRIKLTLEEVKKLKQWLEENNERD